MATQSVGGDLEQLGAAQVGLRMRFAVGDVIAGDDHVEGAGRARSRPRARPSAASTW